MAHSLVVLTDFLAVTNRALSYAAGLAVPLNAQLVLLHVRHDGLPVPDGFGQRFGAAGRPEAVRSLLRLAAAQPIATTVDMAEGLLPGAVAEAIGQHHPLLVVLSRPGTGAKNAELLVDAVMDLLRQTPHPLLLIPAAGWDVSPPQRLLLAVDGQPFVFDDRDHQQVLRYLLHATRATLDVVHVTDDTPHPPTNAQVMDTVRANNLGNTAGRHLHEVYHAEVVSGVMEEAARLKADMLVVVARHHSFWGELFHRSITAQLLQESSIPVLVLPTQE